MRALVWLRWILIIWTALFLAVTLVMVVVLPKNPFGGVGAGIITLAYWSGLLVYLWFSKPRERRAADHYYKRVGDQNELDCLEEMAGTYRRSGYPSRKYIEQVIRDIETNHDPSRLRDSYLNDARDALEERRRLGEGHVLSMKVDGHGTIRSGSRENLPQGPSL